MPSQREVVLTAATVVSLSCGLNYLFSAYAPQIASKLDISNTQINVVGAAGNLGVYLSSPFIGRIVDRKGPRPLLAFAAVALTAGYLIIRAFYVGGTSDDSWFSWFGVPGLVFAELLTGVGSTAGLSSAGNTVAKSYKKRRAAALSIVLSGFGLSAFFYSTLASLFLRSGPHDRDTTPKFLLLIAIGCCVSLLVGVVFVKPAPEPEASAASTASIDDADDHDSTVVVNERTPLVEREEQEVVVQPEPAGVNVSGWALFREVDFYLIFLYNGFCSGVGLCFINNLGTVLRTLAYTASSFSPPPSARDLAQTQSHLVSLLSIFNFLGRLCSGFGSDYFVHHEVERRRISRVWWMVWTSSILTVSQVCAYRATQVSGWHGLVVPTVLTGFAHGSLFGISGVIGLERFGMKNFSGTNGILALAPAIFGQATNLVFGRIYDSHSRRRVSPAATQSVDTMSRPPPVPLCTAGRACYLPAFQLTIAMASLAVVVGLVLALGRKQMKHRAA
ncbi:hypothetical protein JCM10212_002185 [Sporobolomyces blumeae]